MAFEAKVFRVLIASPSDVEEERELAVRTIQEWNDLHSYDKQIVLLPLRWESHSAPEYGRRPQETINNQIVDECDFLIGIFWSKIGTPTGVKESGTIEEIDRVATANKPVMLYFSNAKKDLDEVDLEQLAQLRDFKKRTYPNALVENYSTQIQFRDKLSKHLEMQVRQFIANGEGSTDSSGLLSDIELSFFDFSKNEKNGLTTQVQTNAIEVIDRDEIPDYESEDNNDWLSGRENKDYYRDVADFFVSDNLLTPIKLCMENKGSLGAKDIYVRIKVSSEDGEVIVISGSNYESKKPEIYSDFANPFMRESDDVEITKQSTHFIASFELNALQPKRLVNPDFLLYIGATESTKVKLEATIYADSLPTPVEQMLEIEFQVKHDKVNSKDILKSLSKKKK